MVNASPVVSRTMRSALQWLDRCGGVARYGDFRRRFPEHQTFAGLTRQGLIKNVRPWSKAKRLTDRVAEVHLTADGLGHLQGLGSLRMVGEVRR